MKTSEKGYLDDVYTIFLIWKDFIYEKYQIDNPFVEKDEDFLDLVDSIECEIHQISRILDEGNEKYDKAKSKKDIIIACIDYILLELEDYIESLSLIRVVDNRGSNIFKFQVEMLYKSILNYKDFYFYFCNLLKWEEKVLKEKLDLSTQLIDFNTTFNVDSIFTRKIQKDNFYGFNIEDCIKVIEEEIVLKIYTDTNTPQSMNLLKEGLALFKAARFLINRFGNWSFSFLPNQEILLEQGEIYTILNDDNEEVLAIYEKDFFKDIVNDDVIYSFLYKEAK